jgi:hypothetical protein
MAVYILAPEAYVLGNSSTRSLNMAMKELYINSLTDNAMYSARTNAIPESTCDVVSVPVIEIPVASIYYM